MNKLRIKLSNRRSQNKFLENQLFEKEKIKAFLNDQDMATKSEEIVHGTQEQLKEKVPKYNDLINKHVMLDKELVTVKKGYEDRRYADKGLITSLKNERDHNIKY